MKQWKRQRIMQAAPFFKVQRQVLEPLPQTVDIIEHQTQPEEPTVIKPVAKEATPRSLAFQKVQVENVILEALRAA